MPFIMTHLEIAKAVVADTKIVNNESQFYLGSIAPDCVHVRSNYESNMKKASHFCTEENSWGEIDNTELWKQHILSTLNLYRNNENFDFYLGYFIHIIVDILDSEKLFKLFKEKYSQLQLPLHNRGKAWYNDKSQNDFELYRICTWKDKVWELLINSVGIDIPNIITASEVDDFKEITLHQYDDGKSIFNEPIKYFSLQDNLVFIRDSIQDIKDML